MKAGKIVFIGSRTYLSTPFLGQISEKTEFLPHSDFIAYFCAEILFICGAVSKAEKFRQTLKNYLNF